MLTGWEDGVVKDEFLSSFANLRDRIDKWSLVCLFYHLDYEDSSDETVQIETIVKIICATKGVPYEKPGAATAKPKPGAAAAKPKQAAAPASILKSNKAGKGA